MVGGTRAPLRRDEALAFIISRIIETGISPSLAEIGRALGVGQTRVKELIEQLEKLELVERTPGTQRNLRVRDLARSRAVLAECFRKLGWQAAEPMQSLPCPKEQLPTLPPFEHLPDLE
ncbi:MAG: LexA family protein [Sphingomonas sp.]